MKWLNKGEVAPPHKITLTDDDIFVESATQVLAEINSYLKDRSRLVHINALPINSPEKRDILCAEILPNLTLGSEIGELSLRGPADNLVHLSDLKIRSLTLMVDHPGFAKYRITRCWIDIMMIIPQEDVGLSSVQTHLIVENSFLGQLFTVLAYFRSFEMRSSTILSASLERTSSGLFHGDVIAASIFTPRKDGMYKGQSRGFHEWAEIRKELADKGNYAASGPFHAAEMAILRRTENRFSPGRIIGWIYEKTCDYGNDMGTPLLLLLALSLICTALYVLLGQTKPPTCVGWVKSLCGDGTVSEVWRSLYLGFQPLLQPLSGIVGGSVVEADTLVGYLVRVLQRLASIVLIFMFLLSVRRRFRLSS